MTQTTMAADRFRISIYFLVIFLLSSSSLATTDQSDVGALQVIYSSLNSPPQLTGWKSTGGDPCGESWKGITCEGSSVVAMQVSGLGLNGTMGYLLSDLLSLSTIAIQASGLEGPIPSGISLLTKLTDMRISDLNGKEAAFPPLSALSKIKTLVLRSCNIVGELLSYLRDMTTLKNLDLSFNKLTGQIPSGFDTLEKADFMFLHGEWRWRRECIQVGEWRLGVLLS